MITQSLKLLLLSVFGSLLNFVFSSSPFTLQGQSFKESFQNFSRKIDQENSDSFSSIKNGMNGWTVQANFVDKTCGSTIFRTTGSRTGCLIDSQSSSLRVSCNSTMILMEQFAFSTSCSGQPDSAWTTPIRQCLVSSYSSSVYSCIANPTTTSLPLPKGDWYTSITYDDNICKKRNTFDGLKSNVCYGGWGFSQILRWPLFYTYQSDTCTGRFSYDNVSIYTTLCDDAGPIISNHYYYLHSDGSSYKPSTLSPTRKPSQKPSLRPSATPSTMKPSRRPTFSPTRKPSLKPSVNPTCRPTKKPTSKPVTTSNPNVKSRSIPTLKPSKVADRSNFPSPARRPTIRPSTSKPTRKPSNKHMINNNPDGDTSASRSESPPDDSQSDRHHEGLDPIIAASVSLGTLVMVGLLVWYYKKVRENNGKYGEISRKEEGWDNIEEIPEVL